jgi:hypothetical protein
MTHPLYEMGVNWLSSRDHCRCSCIFCHLNKTNRNYTSSSDNLLTSCLYAFVFGQVPSLIGLRVTRPSLMSPTSESVNRHVYRRGGLASRWWPPEGCLLNTAPLWDRTWSSFVRAAGSYWAAITQACQSTLSGTPSLSKNLSLCPSIKTLG